MVLKERNLAQTPVPADLEALSASAVGQEVAIWSLQAHAGRGVGEHVNDEMDVIFVGISGAGNVKVDGREHFLDAAKLVFVPKGARRATRGTSEDFVYLTVHRRGGPLRIESVPEQKRRR
jgi:quercetin dioxygenase-like cupin family protein